MAVAKVYQNGQWVPLQAGSPEYVTNSQLDYALSFKADFAHKHSPASWAGATTTALASATDWRSPGDGFVVLSSCAYSTVAGSENIAVATIGGVTVLRAYAALIQPNTAYVYSVTGTYPIRAGDLVRFDHTFTVNSQTVTFVP